jgi:hypothetical protein
MRMISPSNRLPFRTIVLGTAISALCGDGAGVAARVHGAAAASHERGFSADHTLAPNPGASAQARARYGKLPLSFESNRGQSDSSVRFLSRGSGYSLFLTSSEAVLVLSQSVAEESRNASGVARTAGRARHRKSAVVRMMLVNANPQSQGQDRMNCPERATISSATIPRGGARTFPPMPGSGMRVSTRASTSSTTAIKVSSNMTLSWRPAPILAS